MYASIADRGSAARFAFAAAIFGEFSEALFWLQLPHALSHFVDKSAYRTHETSQSAQVSVAPSASIPNKIASKGKRLAGKTDPKVITMLSVIICSLPIRATKGMLQIYDC